MTARIVILTLFCSIYTYVTWSLTGVFDDSFTRVALLSLFGLQFGAILWIPFVIWRKEEPGSHPLEAMIQWVAFGGIGLISFLFVLTVVRDLVTWFGWAELRNPLGSAGVAGSAFLFLLLGLFNARYALRVKEVRVGHPKAKGNLKNLRIVQISDLHVGPTIGKNYVEKVVELVNSCKPDLVVLTGDIVDGYVKDLGAELEPLRRIKSIYGTFYVPGNHEYYWEGSAWIHYFRSVGIFPFVNSHKVISIQDSKLLIAGVNDPAARMEGLEGPNFELALSEQDPECELKILLCHQPSFAKQAQAAGFDLMLSGHTHGGQFFPWTLVASWVHRYVAGLHYLQNMAIYVSQGTGYWGPPVRLGAPSEVTLLIL